MKSKKAVKKKKVASPRAPVHEEVVCEWCPTQGGQYTAYYPEFKFPDESEWERIPVAIANGITKGVPFPVCMGGINKTIALYGYEQAMALAWGFAAEAASNRDELKVDVRVQAYEVHYEIKARKIDG